MVIENPTSDHCWAVVCVHCGNYLYISEDPNRWIGSLPFTLTCSRCEKTEIYEQSAKRWLPVAKAE